MFVMVSVLIIVSLLVVLVVKVKQTIMARIFKQNHKWQKSYQLERALGRAYIFANATLVGAT
jgi:hypothetical protein